MPPTLFVILSLSGCDPFPEGAVDSNVASLDCDPEILIPLGLLSGETLPAEPHAETYGATPRPFFVHQGLPSKDPSTSRSFLWRTDVDTLASNVQIGPIATFPDGATIYEGGSFLYGGAAIGEGTTRQHEVRVCGGLLPDTAYTWRVGGAGGWSGTYSFTTPGAPGSSTAFRVAFVGDSRGDYETWAAVAAAIDTRAPDLVVFSGDMVELGQLQSEWDSWFAASAELFARVPLISAHGNHEFLAQQYFVQLGLPGNEEWFAVEWNNTLFVTLNDTVREEAQTSYDEVQLMEREFAASTLTWRVVNHHQPVYSTCTTHGSREDLRQTWGTVWDAANVDLVVAGHNHIYERSVPITAGAESPTGTTYIVSGGAGAPLYSSAEAQWFGLVANPINHYIIADISPEHIDAVAYDLGGSVIDSFSLSP